MGVRNFMVSFYGVYFFPPLDKRAGAATDVHIKFSLTLGTSRSLVDSSLDCRAHEVTPSTYNREAFWLEHPPYAGKHYHVEWMAQQWATVDGSCAFTCKGFALVALESSSHVARWSSSRESATSFILLSSVDVLGLPGLGSLSMLAQPPWKWLAQWDNVLWSTVNSLQTLLKAPWISVGFFLHKVLILM